MKQTRKLILALWAMFAVTCVYSQTTGIKQYLDDGGRTEANTIIKTDISQILDANIPLILERKFGKFIAVQAGAGLLTHNFFKPIIKPIIKNADLYPGLGGGYSLYLQPLIYFGGFESLHFGIPLKFRKHGSQVKTFEWNVVLGYQWFLNRHLALDLEAGVGVNYETSIDGVSYVYNDDIINKSLGDGFKSRIKFPLALKIGYVL